MKIPPSFENSIYYGVNSVADLQDVCGKVSNYMRLPEFEYEKEDTWEYAWTWNKECAVNVTKTEVAGVIASWMNEAPLTVNYQIIFMVHSTHLQTSTVSDFQEMLRKIFGVEVLEFARKTSVLRQNGNKDKKSFALERMREIGVQITEWEKGTDFLIPHKIGEPESVEFGFLLAQLNEHEYPDGFTRMSNPDSKVYEKLQWGVAPPVNFVESYPHGKKYRVYKKGSPR